MDEEKYKEMLNNKIEEIKKGFDKMRVADAIFILELCKMAVMANATNDFGYVIKEKDKA